MQDDWRISSTHSTGCSGDAGFSRSHEPSASRQLILVRAIQPEASARLQFANPSDSLGVKAGLPVPIDACGAPFVTMGSAGQRRDQASHA